MISMTWARYLAARERLVRKFGAGARCRKCRESRVWALTEGSKWRLCYAHASGRSTEINHTSGLRRGPTIRIPSNDHRVLSAYQQSAWPSEFLDRGRSPLTEFMATVVGLVEIDDIVKPSPFPRIYIPPGETEITVAVADAIGFRHVYGTDHNWYRVNARSPWCPGPLPL
jgi:hypothetical protein